MQIRVTDTNDNAPYFREQFYSARVPENAELGSVVIAVTAEDRDEENRLTYSITGGNVGGAFEVVPELGEIKVRAALDYEAGPRVSQRIFVKNRGPNTKVASAFVGIIWRAAQSAKSIYSNFHLQVARF